VSLLHTPYVPALRPFVLSNKIELLINKIFFSMGLKTEKKIIHCPIPIAFSYMDQLMLFIFGTHTGSTLAKCFALAAYARLHVFLFRLWTDHVQRVADSFD
jgi:hypothetical protein